MRDKYFSAALAGLLHNIGKVELRALPDQSSQTTNFSTTNYLTYSANFIKEYIPESYQSLAQGALASDSVVLADLLSAGQHAEINDSKKEPYLRSIFDGLTGLEQGSPTQENYLYLQPLRLNDYLFPVSREEIKGTSQESYTHLRDILRAAAKQNIQDQETYLENLLGAFQRAAWCIPNSSTPSTLDSSLFDHSRMVAALAVCFADMVDENIHQFIKSAKDSFISDQHTPSLDEPIAILIGGDISGVQDFIYTLTSKGAAQTLRGRSFYLQLLTEAVLRYVLNFFELPYTNVIYSGGGNFFLLAPKSAREKLPELRKIVSEKLLRHHGIDMYLAIGETDLPVGGFSIGQFPAYWGKMHAAIRKAKKQRYIELGEELHKMVFQRAKFGGNPEDTCSVCGKDRLRTRKFDEEREEQARICTLCDSFIQQIGKELPHAQFVALGIGKPEEQSAKDARSALAEFGLNFAFLDNSEQLPEMQGVQRVIVWALDDWDENNLPKINALPVAYTLRYTMNSIPIVQDEQEAEAINAKLSEWELKDPAIYGQTKTFTHLETQAKGIKRLGVLRMDVDNLGLIFQNGFKLKPESKQSTATLARLANLSFQISLFFEGWLKKICDEYPELVYVVYAGGDDLFMIAPWDIVPEIARRIRTDFGRFTGQHSGMGLSGGVAFINGKYPIYQAAEDAHIAEQKAKDYPCKDAFTFLDCAMHWDDFDKLSEYKNRLVRLSTKSDDESIGLSGPSSLLETIQRLAIQESYVAEKQKQRPVWGPWVWQGAYMLSRLASQYKDQKKENISREITRIQDDLGGDYKEIYPWGLAARWAELITRKDGGENE